MSMNLIISAASQFGNSAARAGLLLAIIMMSASANAQSKYPDRPIHLVVPYAAGGVADLSNRIVAEQLSQRLKQPVVIDNHPGAGGILAAKVTLAAGPDGYMLLSTGNNYAISANLFKSLPYDTVKDFASTSLTSSFDLLLVTKVGSPLKSLQDFVTKAKANPGKLNIGSTNPGSTQNLCAELFKSTTGIQATIVVFRSSADMATAVLRGDVDVAFEFYAAVQGLMADHKITALASTGLARTAYLPDVPTMKESGLENFEVSSWNGVVAPAGTPNGVIETLTSAVNDVVRLPQVRAAGVKLGIEMRGSTPAEMTARMKADIAKWGAVIEKAGIPKHD